MFLHFFNDESLNLFLENFSCNEFGANSTAAKFDPNYKVTNNSVILKSVHSSLKDANLINLLKPSYPSVVKSQRFIKKGKYLPVVKLDFSDIADKNKLIFNRFFL